nr:phage terminase large subunit family protein [Paracoccus pantotrophus]
MWPRRPTRTNKGKVPLFIVGVGAVKNPVCARLRLTEPGPGAIHFPPPPRRRPLPQLTAARVVSGAIGVLPPEINKAVVTAESPVFTAERHARCPKIHAGANCRVEQPRGNDHEYTRQHLDMDELARLASLDALGSELSAEKRVPAVMHLNKLPDMGRMNG